MKLAVLLLVIACALSGLAAAFAVLSGPGDCLYLSVAAGVRWILLVISVRAMERRH